MAKKKAVFVPPYEKLSPAVMSQLLAISPYLHSTLDLRKLLGIIMNVAVELAAAEDAAVLLLNDATGQLQFEATTRSAISKEVIVPLEASVAGWVVTNGRSLLLNDPAHDPRFTTAVDKELLYELHSLLAVPLHGDMGNRLGALLLLNKKDDGGKNGRCFTKDDQYAAEALTVQAVVAINNARLFAQSDLLAEIIHELKTPMMAISTATGLLLRPDLPSEKHDELLQMIQRESLRLSAMTQDFLDFARLESGRVRLTSKPVDLVALVDEVVDISQPQAATRDIEIQTKLPQINNGLTISGDEVRLKQVLLNLVSNAVKYNNDHGIVTISAKRHGDEVCLSVADNGVGIESQDLAHLFERFYRVPDRERGSEGSGLGLAISKKLVEQHNGRIAVESIPGEGTVFRVHLPLTSKLPASSV